MKIKEKSEKQKIQKEMAGFLDFGGGEIIYELKYGKTEKIQNKWRPALPKNGTFLARDEGRRSNICSGVSITPSRFTGYSRLPEKSVGDNR